MIKKPLLRLFYMEVDADTHMRHPTIATENHASRPSGWR